MPFVDLAMLAWACAEARLTGPRRPDVSFSWASSTTIRQEAVKSRMRSMAAFSPGCCRSGMTADSGQQTDSPGERLMSWQVSAGQMTQPFPMHPRAQPDGRPHHLRRLRGSPSGLGRADAGIGLLDGGRGGTARRARERPARRHRGHFLHFVLFYFILFVLCSFFL